MSDKTEAARVPVEQDNPSDAPKPDWIPLDRAAFYFIPNYTGRGKDWVNAVAELAKNSFGFWGAAEWDLIPHPDEVLVARVGGLELVVDPQAASLWLRGSNPKEGPVFETAFDLAKSPRDFYDAFEELQIKPKSSDAGEALSTLALDLRDRFRMLDTAIADGRAEVFARKNSPLAPFSQIHPDQWQYFRLPRGAHEPAEGPNGEKLFSVHIAAGAKKRAGEAAKTTVRFQTECRNWLISQMQDSPNTQPHPKEYYRAEAEKQLSKFSIRGFESAWAEAKSVTNAAGWGQRGRRKKTTR